MVITAEPTDTQTALPAIRQVLDYQGTPYTVFVATPRPTDPAADRLSSLLASGCTGFYQAVILGNGQLAYNDPAAGFQSALTDPEWQALWNYEATFHVRQVTWYTYPTAEYGFQPNPAGTDTSVTPLPATYTSNGQTVFSYANTANPLTIKNAWAYLAQPSADSSVLLTDPNGNALSVIRTYPDGTQNLAMTFDSNPFLVHDMVLAYGVVNWAMGGLFLGERGVFLSAQADDVFLDAHTWVSGTPCGSDTEQNNSIYRMTGADLQAVIGWQNRRHAQPTTTSFRLDLPFNGEGTTGIYNPDTLTPAARSNEAQFKWINHTFSHENLDNASYSLALSEVGHNIEIGQDLGLTTFSAQNLVTPDVSGLENPAAMRAAFDAGVRYVVTDTSRPGYSNPAPNIGIYNPDQPAILMIPRHPNNLFYNVTDPTQWTEEYNCLYRSFWGRDLSYAEILENESQALLRFMLIGDMDPLMFHQTNLRAYDGTHTLLTDLLDRMLDKYNSLLVLPILSPTMDGLGARMANRMAYTSAGVSASLVPGRQVTITASRAAIVPVTGLRVDGYEMYGGQPISHVALAAGQTLVIPFGVMAGNDSYTVSQGQTLNVSAPGVLGNDTDSDGDALTAVRGSGPSHGTLTLNANGSFTYSHDGSGTQPDSFTYTARDPSGATSNVATVSIAVSAVNHAPVAANNSYSVNQGQTLNVSAPGVLSNDTDSDGDALTAVRVSSPAHGTLTLNSNGSFTYSHDGNGTQTDSFTYTARDPSGATSNVATVSIAVSPVNHAPVAANNSYSVNQGQTLNISAPGVLGNDTDSDGDALTAVRVSSPSHGTLTLNANGSFTYSHDGSGTQTDSFTYTARDPSGTTSNVATVSIAVSAVNHAPVAANNSYSVNQGQTLNISAPGVLSNDTDSDGDALTAVRVSSPSHGTLTLNANGSFTYSHDGNGTQTDSFTYTARDPSGATSNVATVSIAVSPVNHAPVAANNSYSVGEGQTLTISAPGVLSNDTDSDGDALTAVRVSGPSRGTLTLNSNGSFTYSHDGSETLSDSFTYTARDPSGATSNVATVTIAVSPINDPPVARNDTYNMGLLDVVLTVPAPGVLANDTDSEGNALTAALVAGPSRGTLTFNSDGSLVYTPSPSLTSFTDTFTYRARDGAASSNIATVTIQVTRGL